MRTPWLRVASALFFLTLLFSTDLFQTELARFARILFIERQAVEVSPFTQPIDIGASIKGYQAYIAMDFDFNSTDQAGSPNLFQTADINGGLRAELAHGTIGLLYPDAQAPGKMRGDIVARNIEEGRWYHLRLRAIQGDFIHLSISGAKSYDTWARAPQFESDHIILGRGFDATRVFRGSIKNARLTVGAANSSISSELLLTFLKVISFSGFVWSIRGFSNREVARVRVVSTVHEKFDPLLLLRSFACLLVVLGHGMMITHRPTDLTELLRAGKPAWLLTASPWGGVWVFFVLSGYLIGKGFATTRYNPDRAGIWAFYRNRLLRIAPMYWSAILIVSALLRPDMLESKNWFALIHISLFDPGQASNTPIAALWSIGTEIQFYLLAPLVFLLVRDWMHSWLCIVPSIMIVAVSGFAFRTGLLQTLGMQAWPRVIYTTLAGNLDLFLLGFLLNFVILKINRIIPYGIAIGVALMSIGYVAIAYVSAQGMLLNLPDWKMFLFGTCPTLVAITTFSVIFFFELGNTVLPTPLLWIARCGEVLGLMTYAIYLWHEPIFLAAAGTVQPIGTVSSAIGRLAVATCILLIIARIMYVFIEVPFDRKKTRQQGIPGSALPDPSL